MAQLGHLPQVGDEVELAGRGSETAEPVGYRLTVVELDGRRAARLTLHRAPAPAIGE